MIAEVDPDPREWIRRLRRTGREEGFESCASVVRLLANLVRGEAEAEALLIRILDHRVELASALARDPGLQVASVDYLSNVEALLCNPKVVELAQFEKTMQSATTDPLTGLFNRGHFARLGEREIARCRRHHLHFAVVLIDLDRFKVVNDRYGHLVGDLALRKVADCMRKTIRDVDVACRYGGDEFVLLLPETERLGAYVVADRLRTRIREEFSGQATGDARVDLTTSGGIAVFPQDGRELPTLMERADEGLYEAKRSGHDRITLFHRERRAHIRYPLNNRGEIRMHYDMYGSWIPVRGLDISSGGMLVETGQQVARDTSVRFRLSNNRDPVAGPWELQGRVVRVEEPSLVTRRLGVALEKPVPDTCLTDYILTGRHAAGASGGGSFF
jgi:diguanylate cyclase (GGDEF)-like protein